MDTITSTATKLLHQMPSYKKLNRCTDYLCSEFAIDNTSQVIQLNAFDGRINIQKEIDLFTKEETTTCTYCNSRRKVTFSTKTHLLIELVSLPEGKSNFLC